ncbi:MAG TPA: hypothetical protein VFV50_02230 [Bdellovibrionales bacterium]|nr:hypothetical protein [Bdellovibrionales bacterium]
MASYGNFFRAAKEARTGQEAPVRRRPARKAPRQAKGRAKFPLGATIGLAVGLALSVFVLLNVDDIDSMIQHVDIGVFGAAFAEQAPAKSNAPAPADKEKAAADQAAKAAAQTAASKNWTPEQLAVFNKLEDRKRDLDLKEQELAELEEELQKQRVELEERLKELDVLRTKIAEKLSERVGVDQERVSKLVEIYSNMKPQNAAKVFEEIDEDLAVEVLGKMKKKNMADILNLLKPDKAQRLSEKFAGYKAQAK